MGALAHYNTTAIDTDTGWDSLPSMEQTPFYSEEEPTDKGVSPYDRESMNWVTPSSFTQGSIGGLNPVIANDDAYDEDTADRILLLAKKYATESVSLDREDGARLEILNQSVDIENPRYSKEDWQALSDAEVFLAELLASKP